MGIEIDYLKTLFIITQAVQYMLDYYTDWSKITLITPMDKQKKINFYTMKCGFTIHGTDMDGNVKVAHLIMER